MKKLFLVLVAILLMASSAYANVDSEYGPQEITTCYVTGMGDMTSGDVVILQTTSPTYWGRQVTGTTTAGLKIYGVVLGDPDGTACRDGTWIRVQTHGYCPIIKISRDAAVTANSSHLCSSTMPLRAQSHSELNSRDAARIHAVTGNSIALESNVGGTGLTTVRGWLSN